MSYLKRAESILWQMSEMYEDRALITEGSDYFEECAEAFAEEMGRVEQETIDRIKKKYLITDNDL